MLFVSVMTTIGLCEDKDAQVPVKSPQHVIVDGYEKFFCGMPANNGLWSWSNEILVGYNKRDFLEKEGHNYTNKMQGKLLLARSLDGGLTWKSEDPDNYVGDGGEITAVAGKINFTHRDFTMRIKNKPDRFWYSYDRGHTWKGPHHFSGLMKEPRFEGKDFTSRTDYIVNSRDDCLFILSATPGKSGRDFTFTARTTNGGKSFEFVSWIVPPTDPHRGVMPSTVRCSGEKLVTAIRRRQGKNTGGDNCWLDCYVTTNNAKSWSLQSKIGKTGLWNGNPPSLELLEDHRLCCVYGNRSRNQMLARFSSDQGASWGPEIILRDDFQVDKFDDNDFGYPRLVQRPDGKMIAIYYWATKERPQQHIAATIWEPKK